MMGAASSKPYDIPRISGAASSETSIVKRSVDFGAESLTSSAGDESLVPSDSGTLASSINGSLAAAEDSNDEGTVDNFAPSDTEMVENAGTGNKTLVDSEILDLNSTFSASKSAEDQNTVSCKNSASCFFNASNNSNGSLDDDIIAAPPGNIDYAGYITVPLFFIVGICGNFTSICVMLSQQFRKMSVSVAIIALSVSDTWFIIMFPLNKLFVRELLGVDVRSLSVIGCKIFFWLWRTSKMTSSWFVVLICAERFIAVWLPFKVRKLSHYLDMQMRSATSELKTKKNWVILMTSLGSTKELPIF